MPTLEEIEKLVSPDLLRQFAVEVGWTRKGTAECQCPHCGAQLEFITEGSYARWRCLGKKPHVGGSLELAMIGRGLSADNAQALLAGRVGLANFPVLPPKREPNAVPSPRPKRDMPAKATSRRERTTPRAPQVEPDHAAQPRPAPAQAPVGDLAEFTSALRALVEALGAKADTGREPLWGVAELGEFLKVSPKAVYALVAARHVPSLRIGRLLRFDPAEIRRWIESQSVGKVPRGRGLRPGG